MKKKIITIITLLLFLPLLILGCKSNSEVSNNIVKQNNELEEKLDAAIKRNLELSDTIYKQSEEMSEIKEDNNNLLKEINILTNQICVLESTNKSLAQKYKQISTELDKKNSFPEYYEYYSAYYELKDDILHWNRSLLEEFINKDIKNVFHPLFLKKGDQVAGLKVIEIEEDLFWRSVLFSGEFKVKIQICKDDIYRDKYKFEVVDSYADKVATDIFNYNKKYRMNYNLDKGGEKLMNQLGDAYYDGIVVTVILSDYSITYDLSNYVNRANFIKLVSIEEN